MKKIKSVLPLLAIVIAIAGAFAMKPSTPPITTLTYYFTGTSGNEFDASQYSTSAPGGGCSTGTLTCEFQVPDGYSNIADYMTWLNTQSNKQSLYDAQVITKRN